MPAATSPIRSRAARTWSAARQRALRRRRRQLARKGIAEAVEAAVARAKSALPEVDETHGRTLIGYSLGAYRAVTGRPSPRQPISARDADRCQSFARPGTPRPRGHGAHPALRRQLGHDARSHAARSATRAARRSANALPGPRAPSDTPSPPASPTTSRKRSPGSAAANPESGLLGRSQGARRTSPPAAAARTALAIAQHSARSCSRRGCRAQPLRTVNATVQQRPGAAPRSWSRPSRERGQQGAVRSQRGELLGAVERSPLRPEARFEQLGGVQRSFGGHPDLGQRVSAEDAKHGVLPAE